MNSMLSLVILTFALAVMALIGIMLNAKLTRKTPINRHLKNPHKVPKSPSRPGGRLTGLSQIHGAIGEDVAWQHLVSRMEAVERADRFNFVGTHIFDDQYSKDFDIDNIHEIAKICRNSGYCEISKKPCESLSFFKPHPKRSINELATYDLKSIEYSGYCAARNTKIEIDNQNLNRKSTKDQFLHDYLICHYFIENLRILLLDAKYRGTLNSRYDFLMASDNWTGYPGRIDFFARAGEKFYCIESKANHSKLGLWQQVRLSWMQKCGHTCEIYNVITENLRRDEILKIYQNSGLEATIVASSPRLVIENYEPAKYPKAERIIFNRSEVIAIARLRFSWFNSTRSKK